MGPIRGYKKKKKIEKVGQNALPSGSSQQESVDWWDDFSKRIVGITSFKYMLFCFYLFIC